jgi:hypothetical protein
MYFLAFAAVAVGLVVYSGYAIFFLIFLSVAGDKFI